MCKVKPPIAERHDVVVWEEMEIINKFNYFLSYPIPKFMKEGTYMNQGLKEKPARIELRGMAK